jgi:hypothetical protein
MSDAKIQNELEASKRIGADVDTSGLELPDDLKKDKSILDPSAKGHATDASKVKESGDSSINGGQDYKP